MLCKQEASCGPSSEMGGGAKYHRAPLSPPCALMMIQKVRIRRSLFDFFWGCFFFFFSSPRGVCAHTDAPNARW